MKIEKNVSIPKKNTGRKPKQSTMIFKEFVDGTDDVICIEFDSLEELQREYGNIRKYQLRHKLKVADFSLDYEDYKLYIERKDVKHKTIKEDKIKISGIIFQHGNDDYGLWEEFYLTEEEENVIRNILIRHDTEGCSVQGTRKQIAREMEI